MVSYSVHGVSMVSYSFWCPTVSQWRSVVPVCLWCPSFSAAFSSAHAWCLWCPTVSQWRSVVPVVSIVSYSFSVAFGSARGVYEPKRGIR